MFLKFFLWTFSHQYLDKRAILEGRKILVLINRYFFKIKNQHKCKYHCKYSLFLSIFLHIPEDYSEVVEKILHILVGNRGQEHLVVPVRAPLGAQQDIA